MSAGGESRESIATGTLVGGRFRIEAKLGAGGMADVYRVTDIATKRPMALKLLKDEVSREAEAVERVRREGDVLRTLDHPAVVRVETFGQTDEGRIFLVMELLSGETFGERLRRSGALSPEELTPIVTGTCAGLAAAHERGIIHRDLKPDNVYLAAVPDGGVQVKLLDFGIAKVTGKDRLTNTGEVLGTPRYMAPEQLAAERDLDGRTDIYALGVILFEALAGTPPYLAASPTELIVAILQGKHAPLRSYRPDVPAAVEAVVARAMARTREARYATALELATAYVAAAPAKGPISAAPERGVATAFMGSVEPAVAAAMRAGRAASKVTAEPEMKPGTFSDLPKGGGPAARAPAVGDRRAYQPTVPALTASRSSDDPVTPAPASATPEPERSSRDQISTRAERTPTPRVPRAAAEVLPVATPGVPSGAPARPRVAPASSGRDASSSENGPRSRSGGSSPTESSSDYRLPTHTARTKLWVGGLLAGALSAGIAILVLSLVARRDRESDSPPVPAAAEPSESRRERRQEREREREREEREERERRGEGSEASAASEQSAAELLTSARDAFGSGDNARCVGLVDRAVAAGADASAHRLRGDCQLASGDREAARASYEEYCRGADGPGIAEVRDIVIDLGGRCP